MLAAPAICPPNAPAFPRPCACACAVLGGVGVFGGFGDFVSFVGGVEEVGPDGCEEDEEGLLILGRPVPIRAALGLFPCPCPLVSCAPPDFPPPNVPFPAPVPGFVPPGFMGFMGLVTGLAPGIGGTGL